MIAATTGAHTEPSLQRTIGGRGQAAEQPGQLQDVQRGYQWAQLQGGGVRGLQGVVPLKLILNHTAIYLYIDSPF